MTCSCGVSLDKEAPEKVKNAVIIFLPSWAKWGACSFAELEVFLVLHRSRMWLVLGVSGDASVLKSEANGVDMIMQIYYNIIQYQKCGALDRPSLRAGPTVSTQ
jgi:hypothetical protein